MSTKKIRRIGSVEVSFWTFFTLKLDGSEYLALVPAYFNPLINKPSISCIEGSVAGCLVPRLRMCDNVTPLLLHISMA